MPRANRHFLPVASGTSLLAEFWSDVDRKREVKKKTVTLSVAVRDDVTRRARAAFKGKKQGAHISFSSIELLWQTVTKKRWEVLKAMTGQDAMTLREVARRVGRDVKGVHRDVHALL